MADITNAALMPITQAVVAYPASGAAGAAAGGGITWAYTLVTFTGSSQTVLAANAARKAVMLGAASANANAAAVDITGGTASLTRGLPLAAGEKITLMGAACPVGAITGIGTAAQTMAVYEGT